MKTATSTGFILGIQFNKYAKQLYVVLEMFDRLILQCVCQIGVVPLFLKTIRKLPMASTTKEEESEKQRTKDIEFKFKKEPADVVLKEAIMEIYKKHAENKPTLPQLAEKIKKDLDSKFSKGWIVFAGTNMVGACSYIEGTLADVEVDNISFVLFQTYCPEQ